MRLDILAIRVVFGSTLLSPCLTDAINLTRSTIDTARENAGLRVAEEGERSHMYMERDRETTLIMGCEASGKQIRFWRRPAPAPSACVISCADRQPGCCSRCRLAR